MEKADILREKMKAYERDLQQSKEQYENAKVIADRRITEARNRYELEKRQVLRDLSLEQRRYFLASQRYRQFRNYHKELNYE